MVAAVGTSAGILAPILIYWISSRAATRRERNWASKRLRQTVAAGSPTGGMLFDFAPVPDAPFLLMTVLAVLGILLSLGLPKRLVTGKYSEAGYVGDV